MVWGKEASTDVSDLVNRITTNAIQTLHVMSARRIGTEGLIQIAHALSVNTSIQDFNMSGRILEGSVLAAFVAMLRTNRTIQRICIGHDGLGDEGVKAICTALECNHGLVELDLENKSVGLEGVYALAKLLKTQRYIRRLILARNLVDGTGARALLESISLNSVLQEINLANNQVDATSMSALVKCIDENTKACLTRLDLSFNPIQGCRDVFRALKTNQTLVYLNLSHCQVGDVDVETLSETLANNTSLIELNLSFNKLGTEGLRTIAEGLKTNQTLKKLSVGGNHGGGEGAVAMGETLAHCNTVLQFLDYGSSQLSYVGIAALLKASQLLHLSLYHNALSMDAARIATTLHSNRSLTRLDLCANQLHGRLAATVLDAISAQSSLRVLELGGNDIGEVGEAAIERLKDRLPSIDVARDKGETSSEASACTP